MVSNNMMDNHNGEMFKLHIWSFFYNTNLQPPSVCGGRMVYLDDQVVLYGGKSPSSHNYIYCLDLEDFQWTRIIPKNLENRSQEGLFVYRNKLFLFGGEFKYNKDLNMRECANDLHYFDFNKQRWEFL